ncbi:MAG TPA: class I SAM-dependent methyltransferase [bacterium]|nr:class I SAM-dependent methyltransferase [bacterium]
MVENIQQVARTIGSEEGIAFDNLRATLLTYDPLLQASFHITPIKSGSVPLPGTDSEFFQIIINTLFSDILPWTGGERSILTPDEIRTLYLFSLSLPHVIDSLEYLTDATTVADLLGFARPLSLSDRSRLFLVLLESFAKPNPELIRTLSKRPSDLMAVVYTLLSAIPQFDDLSNAKLNRGPDHPRRISNEEKLRALKSQAHEFKTLSDPPFRSRLFLVLSLIESLRWENGSWFYIIPNLYKYFPSGTYKHTIGLNLLCLYLSGPDICRFLETDVVVGSRTKRSQKAHKTFCRKLLDLTAQWSDFITELKQQECLQQNMLYSEVREDIGLALCRSLLSHFEPKALHLWRRENDSYLHFMWTRQEGRTYDHTGSQELAAHSLLLSPWGRYALRQEVLSHMDSEIDQIFSYDGVRITRSEIRFPLPISSPTNDAVLIRFPEDINPNILPAFQLRSFVLRFSKLLSHMRVDDRLGDWYCKAFGSLYHKFDVIRQSKESYSSLREHEIPFLAQIITEVPNAQNSADRLLVDLGIGYGRVESRLFPHIPMEWRILGVDLSQILLNEAKNSISSEYLDRLTLERADLRNLNIASYRGTCDVVLLLFSTFGCFPSSDENEKLFRDAYELLKPGGIMVIEQYNPALEKPWPRDLRFSESQIHTTSLVNTDTEWHELEDASGLKLVITRQIEKHDAHTHYFGHYFYFILTDGDARMVQCDAYNLHLYHRAWFTEQAGKLCPSPANFSTFGDFSRREYNEIQSPLLIVQLQKDLSGIKSDRIVTDDMKERAITYLKNASSLIANAIEARNNLGKSSYPFLCRPPIANLLNSLSAKRDLLHEDDPNNVSRVVSVSKQRFDEMDLAARRGGAKNWKKDALLERVLSALSEMLDK